MSKADGRPLVYVPWSPTTPGWSIERANRTGAAWLSKQSGAKLVLVSSLQSYRQNDMARYTRDAQVARPVDLWKTGWRAGPVLAPWPTEEILGYLSARMENATAICVIEWGENAFQTAWLQANRALSVIDGSLYLDANNPLLDPVVEAAMIELGKIVNHSNALVGVYDKEDAISTLLSLSRGGYHWDTDKLCAWALAHGFTDSEERNLRDYSQKTLSGHRFRLKYRKPNPPRAIERWRQAAVGKKPAD